MTQPQLDSMRVLMLGICPSLSGISEISYMVGCPTDTPVVSAVCFRITDNSSSGKWNGNWVPLKAIEATLADTPAEAGFTAAAFKTIYAGGSTNSPGFLGAILLHLGLMARVPDSQSYVRHTAPDFWEQIRGLIESGVNLVPDGMDTSTSHHVSEAFPEPAKRPKKKLVAANP